jgi:hypothetical protein
MSKQWIVGGTSALLLLAGASTWGDTVFPALGTAASENAALSDLDDAGLAGIEGGEDLGAMISGIVKNALNAAGKTTNTALRQTELIKRLVLKQAQAGKPLAPGFKYYFVNGKLVRKEKLPNKNSTIVQSVSKNSTTHFTNISTSAQLVSNGQWVITR